ncbi:phosphoadenosine phosphosulfate reductase family protein [Acinetobacter guillouiae]|uniref:phosphoadenosine phosphosulfate reductase domain-containing protein n=1 Tax=Acinetobacter guillouiae TaxID=106649 RepID=UPI003AF4372A
MNQHSYFLDELEAGALFVLNHSGGKDSQAMMINLLRIVPKEQLLVVHASLGDMEWHGALELAESQAKQAGVPFIVARAKKSLLEMAIHRYKVRPEVPSFPSSKHRQCTSDLKRGPITREVRRYAKENGFTHIVNCMGLRAQESSNRAKKSIWKENAEHGRAGRSWYDWLPIHGITTDEVFQTIKNAGQNPHFAYSLGNERLSCVFCIMASSNDIKYGALHRPELYALYCFIEQMTGYTMHMSMKSLPEITGIQPDYSLLNQFRKITSSLNSVKFNRQRIAVVEVSS